MFAFLLLLSLFLREFNVFYAILIECEFRESLIHGNWEIIRNTLNILFENRVN